MKTCPVCQRPYADETMMFCLADGAELVNVSRRLDLDATWRLTPPKTEPSPTVAAPQANPSQPQSTIQYRPELQMAQPQTVTSVPNKSRSVLPWIFGMVVVLAGSAIVIAVILTRSRNAQSEQLPTVTQQSTPTPATDTKTSDKPSATSANANKPKSAPTQTVPAVRALITSERPKSSIDRSKRETSKVNSDKKKAEPPKPTGESFIPASRP
jgi:hypothetical protein